MSDMNRQAGRTPYQRNSVRERMPWVLAALAVGAILGFLAWTMDKGSFTASNPTDQTTGQGPRPPALAPAPAPSR
jgi:hypothetical protein